MTTKQIFNILKETGLPVAYREFKEDEEMNLPIIVFEEGESNVFAADGVPYYVSPTYDVELQTDDRDIPIERSVESVLLQHELFFSKSEPAYNEEEQFYSIIYRIEV